MPEMPMVEDDAVEELQALAHRPGHQPRRVLHCNSHRRFRLPAPGSQYRHRRRSSV